MIGAALRFVRLAGLAWSLSHDVALSIDVARDAIEATGDAWEQDWVISWCFRESRWRADAVDPTGRTFGSCQVDAFSWGPVPETRVAQFEQAVSVLRTLKDAYGTRRRALNAYASGKPDLNLTLVTERCALIGGLE